MRNYVAFYRGEKIVVKGANRHWAHLAAGKAFFARAAAKAPDKAWAIAIVLADIKIDLID